MNRIRLGVNIDHVATLRQARGTPYPSPVEAAQAAQRAGAHNITMHLREDRRHIQEADLFAVKTMVDLPINFEMALTKEMLLIAERLRPMQCCIVPEKRQEQTTEGGLDLSEALILEDLRSAIKRLQRQSIRVSLFVEPELDTVVVAQALGVDAVELHTGAYADALGETQKRHLQKIEEAAVRAASLGLEVHAGHGLNRENVGPIAALSCIHTLNIGHALVARAIFFGMEAAVAEILQLAQKSR